MVIGDVVKVNPPKEIVIGEGVNDKTGAIEPHSNVYIVSEVKVSRAIKGKYSPGDIVEIKQYGEKFSFYTAMKSLHAP